MEKDYSVLDDFTWQELVTEVYRRGIVQQNIANHINKLIADGELTYAERSDDGQTDTEV